MQQQAAGGLLFKTWKEQEGCLKNSSGRSERLEWPQRGWSQYGICQQNRRVTPKVA